MPSQVYVCDASEANDLKRLMEYDPYLDKNLNEQQLADLKDNDDANTIFARQDYSIKDGISINLDSQKYYLYISASEEFLARAEKKLKANIKSIKRADKETEDKVINLVEGERQQSEEGIGSIFG
ncbi:MAG: hypothetical protein M1156_00065 [Candidatus Marsarchaeota archaeon]|jgi:hypothetical protein|nr:hypothetical protein [Candidatus Marsarchaeota archaeon]